MKLTTRTKLVDAIIDLSSDEVDVNFLRIIAAESEEELLDRLIHIAEYYRNEVNNN